ncbi:MAG: hypothetical protein Q9170_006984 [Blastenia crenularia]
MHRSTILISAFIFYQSLVSANPLPNPQYSFPQSNSDGGGDCTANAHPDPEYETTSQVTKAGAPIQIGDSCTPSKGQTCTLGRESSYSVGVSVSVGVDLCLDFSKIVSAGINAEVAIETTTGTTDTNQQECSGPWACSMIITPSVQEVAGTQHAWVGCPSEKKTFPYTAQFPIKNGDHLPVEHGEPCQCRNFPGFDEGNPDAPKPCPNDC